ncbi:NAD(P)/FAD-dependent oxidoreductase [Actinoplanes sp. NPDC051470]|uniref:NAD(P)/FAD-dependent oxidoreductase n=1 Tax=Actinoplanes sp. NPDC051470 TaxID=3157224 RepID=UPI003414B1C0
MVAPVHDVIVIGARCAGSPTAMLLARRGHRVLLVDRATFPSDTVSSHVIHPPGVDSLRRWGLLDRVAASGCPPVGRYSFDFGDVTLAGSPGTAYAPRRTVLDKVLLDAAAEAGAEVREGFTVDDVVLADDQPAEVRGRDATGAVVRARARVVVGADGRNSLVAKVAQAGQYHVRSPMTCGYYSYWSDLPADGLEVFGRPGRGWAACPTNDGLTMVIGCWPYAELTEHRDDVEDELGRTFDRAPGFAERLRSATREHRIVGATMPNYLRTPYGPGWALVGDAGYNRDFITAQGISDAFRDAELCAGALDEALSGKREFEEAMADYWAARDAQVLPMYELTATVAALQAPDDRTVALVNGLQGDQDGMDAFARMSAGVTSPADFFALPRRD